MAYINSANVKFSNLADLIIEEDGAGNVTSVFNRSDNIEYIGNALNFRPAITTFINNTANNINTYNILYNNATPSFGLGTVNAGGTLTRALLKDSITHPITGYHFVIISGDAEPETGNNMIVRGDCTLEVIAD